MPGFFIKFTKSVVLNFLDNADEEDDSYEIISSIAMSKDRAKLLIKALDDAIGEDENDSE